MEKNIKYRHEFKYLCSEAQMLLLENRIKMLLNYDPHAVGGQYSIRSMYFDNYENRCYYENECGVDPREKFRIRIYNASNERISLECKRKEKGKTHKSSCLLSLKDFEDIINGGVMENIEDKPKVLRKFIILLKTELFRPSIITEYDRTPYVYDVGNVRITFDKNIRSSNDFGDFFNTNLHTRQILPTGQHLLEVKYDELLPDFIKEALQLETLQRTTFSKYYLCKKYSMGV